MKCLETRRRNGMRWRRYRTEDGASWATYEVPTTVINLISTRRLVEELQRAERKLDRLNRNAKALSMMKAGVKPLAVAYELGISESLARRIYQQHRKESR